MQWVAASFEREGICLQSYYYLKLRCVLRDLLIGFTLVIVSASIIAAITRDMMLKYSDSMANAYRAGLGVSIVMLLAGLICICLAFAFEKMVFGKKRKAEREILKQDLEGGRMAAGRNILITEHFILTLSPLTFSGCSLIHTDKLAACFEEDGPTHSDGSLQLTFVDESFHSYEVLLEGESAQTGREIIQAIYERMPWIYSKGRARFQDKAATRSGRKRLLQELKHRREDALKGFPEEELSPENIMQDKPKVEYFMDSDPVTVRDEDADQDDEKIQAPSNAVIQAGVVSNEEDMAFVNEAPEESEEIGL